MRRTLAAALAAVTLLLGTASPALAATCPNPKTTLSDLEDEVMCPRCGTPLNVVDSEPQANRERAFIQSQIDQCKSKKEIKAALVAQYGPEILAEPPKEGFDLAAYWVPILLGALAALTIAVTASKWRGSGTGPTKKGEDGPELAPDDAARLDRDLERYKL